MNVGGNMKKTKTLNLLIVLLTMFALTSCAFIQKTNKRKQIVTTLYPEYDMINKIIGTNQETKDLFDVTLIIPPGQDSHTFDPSIQDLITIKNADIFIYTADEMETWVKDVDFGTDTIVIDLSKDSYKKTDDVDKTSRIKLFQVEDDDDDEEPGHDHNHVHAYDPHYWLYPIYSIYMVEQIRDVLINNVEDPFETRPITKVLTDNANAYIDELKKVDQALTLISQTSTQNTMYFGSPFSFYYWHVIYGFDYELTYSTCSTETEPPINVLSNIIDKMKANNIKYIFAKELVNQEACEMISFHTKAEILVLHSGHNVSVEDFRNPDASYLTILWQDVENLSKMLNVDYNQIIKEVNDYDIKMQ